MAGQPNMNAMLKQVQKMQADMAKAQEELKNEVVEASAGGGMVTVKVSGDLEIREIRIDPGHGARGGQRGRALGPGAGRDEDERGGRRPGRAGRARWTRPTRLLGCNACSQHRSTD